MPQQIINSLRSPSVIRVVDAGTYTISLANLAASAAETVSTASIKSVAWSTSNNIVISRNSQNVLSLYGTGEWRLADFGSVITANNDSNIVITVVDGTAILEVSKEAIYNPVLETL
jgi:hypothetical protein